MSEVWRPVPGYEGRYEVSDLGNVVSVGFADIAKRRPLKKVDQRGYDRVYLRSPGTRGRWFSMHILVMLAFVGPRPDGMHVNHVDGHKKNNALSNLQYCTPSQNQKHSFSLGLQSLRGEKHTQAKLTEAGVIEIRAKISRGVPRKVIALDHGISDSHLSHIASGRLWSHIPFAGEARVIQSRG